MRTFQMMGIVVLLYILSFVPTRVLCAQAQQKPQAKAPNQSKTTPRPRAPQLAPIPQPITTQQAFNYWVAIYGAPQDIVDRYAREFDAYNYKSAMGDEFERGKYRAGLAAQIARNAESISFKDKFSYVTRSGDRNGAAFGEYNFVSRAFPIRRPNTGFDYLRYESGFEINPFDLAHTLNARDYIWALPMNESAAKAFLTRHPDRQLFLRFVYSITPHKREVHSSRYYFTPFIHSIEVFSDRDLTNVVTKLESSRLPGTWRDARGLEPGSKTLYYKTRYRTWRGDGLAASKGDALPSQDGAQYRRTLDFDGGAVRVKDHYISGELEMDGQYLPVCADEDQELCPDGTFTWYYENGLKRQEASFRGGEDVAKCGDYVRSWDESGKCEKRGKGECLCVDQGAPPIADGPGAATAPSQVGGESGYLSDAARASGSYVSRAGDSVELKDDGTFVLRFRGQTMRGSFTIEGDDISLKLPSDTRPARVRLSAAGLTFPSGETYVKQ